MPNFDGGHYFLTVLAPVLADPIARADKDGSITSPTASLRESLASLPTAQQSPACIEAGHGSPFSRCHRTHFARLVVIDQPSFNGRDAGNAIVQSVMKTDLLAHQPVDSLTRAWLMLAIDFDAGSGEDRGLHGYLLGLWDLMGEELAEIFRHCHGFSERVRDGDGFARYIRCCQVETTMPFNDYWTGAPPLPALSLGGLAALVAGLTVAAMLLAWGVVRLTGIAGGWTWAALPFALALALYLTYRFIGGRGARPFPVAPNSDLRSVLKALHLQQHFARFAADQQGQSPAALHDAFARFVAELQPASLDAATQAPGVIRS